MINVFVLNWNSCHDVKFFFDAIKLSENCPFRIILIQNSKDDTLELVNLANKYSRELDIHFVENNSNLGYAAGNNAGLNYLIEKNLLGDIVIANPDIKVGRRTLNALSSQLIDYPNVGASMIRTLNSEGVRIYDSIKLNGLSQKYRLTDTGEEFVVTDYVAGAFFIIRRELAEKLKLFDDDFFMYWEEVDLSLRIKKLGYSLTSVVTDSIERRSNPLSRTPNAIFYSTRNSFLLYRKHSEINFFHLSRYLISMFLISTVKSFKNSSFTCVMAFLQGLIYGVRMLKNKKRLN